VLRGERSGIEITVVGRDWQPESCSVEKVADPALILDRLRDAGPAHRADTTPARDPEPLPVGLRGEPHQALAEAVLRNAAAHAAWQTDGGPAPEPPGYWSELWQAAVHRQTQLSGQDASQAADTVRAMTSQLAGLFHEHAWFRTDENLRQRAVTEVLFYYTGLAAGVPGRPAQEEWRLATANNAAPQIRAAAHSRWRTAWQSWASADR
jgi:hypothetical protein